MHNVYGWDYQGIYTSVTFPSLRSQQKVLTKFPWRIAISDDLSLLPVRSDCVFTLNSVALQFQLNG